VSVGGNILKINTIPANKDILSERNVILKIDTGSSDSIDVTVNVYDPYSSSTAASSIPGVGY